MLTLKMILDSFVVRVEVKVRKSTVPTETFYDESLNLCRSKACCHRFRK